MPLFSLDPLAFASSWASRGSFPSWKENTFCFVRASTTLSKFQPVMSPLTLALTLQVH